jgi:predicted phosphodiesterase
MPAHAVSGDGEAAPLERGCSRGAPRFERLAAAHRGDTDTIILGHTHQPMHVRVGPLQILNPGSVYGVTSRDSHSCATLPLPTRDYRVFELCSGEALGLPITRR